MLNRPHNASQSHLHVIAILLALVAAVTVAAGPATAEAAPKDRTQPGLAERPNVVLIQTDDQVRADVFATFRSRFGDRYRVMPALLDLIAKRGISFERYYATYPLCCPARATLLTGQYAHSNGVISNTPPRGGWPSFRDKPAYRHNLATWLQANGYRTIHLGKFLNHYGTEGVPEATVPPGWSDWRTNATDNSTRFFYGYMQNINGEISGPYGNPNYGLFAAVDPPGCLYGPSANPLCNHKTDMATRQAVEQIQVSSDLGKPFYMQVDYTAPHGDSQPPIGPEPTVRNYGRADFTPLPRGPAFNEADISDKPSFIREKAPPFDGATIRRIRNEYRKTLESLRDVDDGIRRIVGALRRSGQLQNTYIIFTSDNGFFRGEHRLERAKFLPYEPAVHMPLFIRGPGIKPRTRTGELTANIDLAPTILDLAGARPTRAVDGRSMVPFLRDPKRRTRRPILLESYVRATAVEDAPEDGEPLNPAIEPQANASAARPGRGDRTRIRRAPGRAGISISAPIENYGGVRLGRYKYVEYETGDGELYDLARDPHELKNRINFPNYRYVQGFMAHQLRRLVKCGGAECRYTTGIIPVPGEPKAVLKWGPRQKPKQRAGRRPSG